MNSIRQSREQLLQEAEGLRPAPRTPALAGSEREQLLQEVEGLRQRLAEAEETLQAIRRGDVDALVIAGPQGERLYTLNGAAEPYRILIEEMSEGAVTLSAEGLVLYSNQHFADLVRVPLERVIGLPFESFLPEMEREAFGGLLAAGRKGKTAAEFTLRLPDAGLVPANLSINRLPDPSAGAVCLVVTNLTESKKKEVALLNMMEDLAEAKQALEAVNRGLEEQISQRERAEAEVRKLNAELEQHVRERTAQLEAANHELEAFAYSVSHDLRGPLRYIGGYVNLLDKAAGAHLPGKSRHYMEEISGSVKQMGELVDDLLAFSRMGRVEMRQEPFDLSGLMEESVRQLERELNGRNIRWRKGRLPEVRADRAMLRQVLLNLLSNAIKYTRPRDPAEIEYGCASETAQEVVIFIRDNGVGFDMTYVHKLFGVFQRLHSDEEFEGTGIGLASVRRIIARHGGRTWAEGKVNGGATFYFSLPKAGSRLGPSAPVLDLRTQASS